MSEPRNPASFADLLEIGDRGDGSSAAAGESAAPATAIYAIREWADVAVARHQARRLARAHGFAAPRAGEVAIVVSELASNIVKYGVRGDVTLAITPGPAGGAGVTVVARDFGPPFHDLATALRDGHDDRGPIDPAALARRGGLGTGLGAVSRLADRFTVRQKPGQKEITATLGWRAPAARWPA